jgi:hypothetical protein
MSLATIVGLVAEKLGGDSINYRTDQGKMIIHRYSTKTATAYSDCDCSDGNCSDCDCSQSGDCNCASSDCE